jgi:hypothetical protein
MYRDLVKHRKRDTADSVCFRPQQHPDPRHYPHRSAREQSQRRTHRRITPRLPRHGVRICPSVSARRTETPQMMVALVLYDDAEHSPHPPWRSHIEPSRPNAQ